MAQPAKRLRIDTSLKSKEADVFLTLQARGNEDASGTNSATADKSVTLKLHAEVLQKYSAFFSAQLSGRWEDKNSSTDSGPVCVTVKECEDLDAHTRSLQLLYRLEEETKEEGHTRHLFENVKDAACCM